MNIVMFSFLDDMSGDGCRVITSMLKEKGHSVTSCFLPFYGAIPNVEIAPEAEQAIGGAQLFMLSVLSCYETRAAAVTRYLRQQCPDIPIVWGGVHATALPEACLKYADYVIRGECEMSTLDFVDRLEKGGDLKTTPNVAYLDDNGQMISNPLSQLPFDLDSMPFPDYDLEDHFVLDGDKLLPATLELYDKYHTTFFFTSPTYFTITTRGCPFTCSYCHQSELINTYPNSEYRSRKLRYKSVDRTFEELKFQLARLPFIKQVGFSDDDFFCRKPEQIKEFAERWPTEIGIPFGVAGIPLSITEEKLKMVLDAGCKKIQIGIQSGSDRVNRDIYGRYHSKEKLLRAVELLDKYHGQYKFNVDSDWIIDCPWENEADVLDSVELALKLPRWIHRNVFTLTFYPGTAIWTRGIKEGMFDPSENIYEQAFHQLRQEGHSYMTHVFLLHSRMKDRVPNGIIKALSSKPGRFVGERLPNWLLNGVWNRRMFPTLLSWSTRDVEPEPAAGMNFG